MSDDDDGVRGPPTDTSTGNGGVAVAAHALLGDIAAVQSAIQIVLSADGDDPSNVLELAVVRLDAMAQLCRDLVTGMPVSAPSVFEIDLSTHPSMVALTKGTLVELHSAFNDTWVTGFEIVEPVAGGYRVRRVFDGTILPGHTSLADMRVSPIARDRQPGGRMVTLDAQHDEADD